MNKTNQNHQNHVNDAINSENRENIGDMQEAEPSTSNTNPPLRGEAALADDGTVISSIANNREWKNGLIVSTSYGFRKTENREWA